MSLSLCIRSGFIGKINKNTKKNIIQLIVPKVVYGPKVRDEKLFSTIMKEKLYLHAANLDKYTEGPDYVLLLIRYFWLLSKVLEYKLNNVVCLYQDDVKLTDIDILDFFEINQNPKALELLNFINNKNLSEEELEEKGIQEGFDIFKNFLRSE